ncbi:hypothetical protein Y88_1229 [Novosphingobium nitrogenifigens DSM 19370]|uniref:Outer membrane protein beta-barrel domain-containing protein n=2 Tax=Novosphingobium nitrogenifigens TaxID=378548 RepID=F1Z858_9SPHN|nr:hypothetical protein [Novosphingobium nitrogenifigens]EGD59167.1 hypothetical protein Y88_1229 [Novosphingobium nitrogenifigens DSM 19370]
MMRLVLWGSAFAGTMTALALATPAMADETRVEVHTGLDWSQGNTKGTIGIAGGRDFTLAPGTFLGVEGSLDKLLASNAVAVFGLTARGGIAVPTLGKIYALGGYATKPFHGGSPDWNYGFGVQHPLGAKTYAKLEYRHYTESANGITPVRNAMTVGFGATF